MDDAQVNEQLAALADHLVARRTAVLENWRHAVDGDAELTTASTLVRREFYDHIPAVLETFEQTLRSPSLAQKAQFSEEQKERAAEHGQHRWHHGYNQQDVMREWGHLHLCLVNELENYTVVDRSVGADALATARRALAQLCSNGVTESALRYTEMQQREASGRIRDLERAMEDLKELERARGEIWRRAVHDVRGNFGVIKNISDQLRDDEADEPLKNEFLGLLQRSVTSLHNLLNNLLVLSRLEAGQERRQVQAIDAAAVLTALCNSLQPLASERNLQLRFDGPAALPVQGDPVNIQRIAQNLLLNALKYTPSGSVTVAWTAADTDGVERWAFSVEDTGPGLQTGAIAPLADAIEKSTLEAEAVEQVSVEPQQQASLPPAAERARPITSTQTQRQTPGEGIGLAIVKRLCELLDATLELKTELGRGSTFRVVLPRRYEDD